MDSSVFQGIYNQQKAYFNRQATKSYEQRVESLKDIRAQILKYETLILTLFSSLEVPGLGNW